MSWRRATWQASRVLGDLDAASKGPTSYARRVVRRSAYKHWNKILRRALRAAKLSR